MFQKRLFCAGLGLTLLWLPLSAQACAACYGASDSPMAQGMNWGIMSLLGFIGCVLAGVVSVFVYVGRKAALRDTDPSSETATRND